MVHRGATQEEIEKFLKAEEKKEMSETINNYVPPAPVPDGDTGEPVRAVLGVPFDSRVW